MLRLIPLCTASFFFIPTLACSAENPGAEQTEVAAPSSTSTAPAGWWWPVLPAPKAYVRTVPINAFGEGRERQAVFMMVQSASGLAAAAVKRGEFDEMVWVESEHPNQRLALEHLNKRLAIEDRGVVSPWELVQRLIDAGVVKGYILYNADRRNGGESVNVATSLAGPMRAIIVDEQLEAKAQELGLTRLEDVREKDSRWLFENHKDKFNRHTIAFQNPRAAHLRDYTVAHDVMVLYGNGDVEREALAWLEPLSPILGWNGGDEGQNTKMFSQYGHFNTATDWALNLPLLSAGAQQNAAPKYPDVNSSSEAAKKEGDLIPAVAFVMSDGDNLQWMTQNFFADHTPRYWQNPMRDDFPMTWTICIANLRQAAPDLLRYSVDSLPANATVVEFGGGYYFPDVFGSLREEKDLLAEQARRTWANMQATNVDVLCLIFDELKSEAARAAMRIYAEEMPGLRGILAMDYAPYSEGAGDIYWIERESGEPLPVVTARYELRTDFKIQTTGGVDEIARLLTEQPLANQWVVQHAWSSFQSPSDPNRRVTGLDAMGWTIKKLGKDLNVVTVQEMFDRLTDKAER